MKRAVVFACKVCGLGLLELVIEKDTPAARGAARELLMAKLQEHLRQAPRCLDAYEEELGLAKPPTPLAS